jgi:hypothetical protein
MKREKRTRRGERLNTEGKWDVKRLIKCMQKGGK